jgi:hypothetical protein
VKLSVKISLLAILLSSVSSVARADLYESAYFSGELIPVTGSLADIGLSGTNLISGNFVFDEQLVPGANSGIQSVSFSNMPAIASIPPTSAFQMTLAGLTFNLGNFLPGTGGIVYNNGQFDGFDVAFDFYSDGTEYRFVEQGTAFEIEALVGNQPTGVIVVAGTIDFGPLFNIEPYVPISSGLGSNTGVTVGNGNGDGDGTGGDSNDNNPPPNNNQSTQGNDPPPSGNNSPPGNNTSPSGGTPSPVPEPGVFWVLAAAMIIMGTRVVIMRRRAAALKVEA